MAFNFPWTNLHELNLDWFLSKFKQFANNFLETTATAESVAYGTQPSVTVTGGELDDDTDIANPFNFNFKIPAGQQGAPGAPGAPGQDGFSPVATVTKSGDTATITITDENGTTTATISDGTSPTIDAYPVEDSTDAVSSGGMYDIEEQVKNNLAWVENTNTASRAYAIGDYVIINDVLCKITASVANGGTLTNGTNYTEVGGSGGLTTSLNTVETLTVSDVATPITGITISTIKRRNNKIFMEIVATSTITVNNKAFLKLGTIKSEYRPSIAQNSVITINTSTSGQIFGTAMIEVNTAGSILLYTGQASTTYGSTSYPALGVGQGITYELI